MNDIWFYQPGFRVPFVREIPEGRKSIRAIKYVNANAIEALQSEAAALRDEVARLRGELEWYGEQSRLARLIHSEGDVGRHALAADGGKRARAALAAYDAAHGSSSHE